MSNPTSGFGPSRRNFLLLFAGGVIAAATFVASPVTDEVDLVVRIVARHLDYLDFEDSDARQFAKDFILHKRSTGQFDRRKLALAARFPFATSNGIRRYLMLHEVCAAVEALERSIVTDFLIAFGFFHNGMNTEQKLRYDGLIGACRNPFACFD